MIFPFLHLPEFAAHSYLVRWPVCRRNGHSCPALLPKRRKTLSPKSSL